MVAKYSDGANRTVNNLALYLTNNKTTADIDEQGVVTRRQARRHLRLRALRQVHRRRRNHRAAARQVSSGPSSPPATTSTTWSTPSCKNLRILPSAAATDEQFLRRVYLDLVGLLPTPEEYDRFMKDRAADKRAKLIDDCWRATNSPTSGPPRWAEMLKIRSDNNSSFGTDRKAAYAYYQWIHDQVKKNTPLDQFVRAQVASTGSNLRNPAVNLYTMLPQGQYDPKAVAQDVAAGLHGHPRAVRPVPQSPLRSLDAGRLLRLRQLLHRREAQRWPPKSASSSSMTTPTPRPPSTCSTAIRCPRTSWAATPLTPRAKIRAVALADWLTAKDNPLFRENLANRIWAQFFGRGIVDPVDDVRISNPPSNRELLQALGQHLADYNFDAKRLIRDICNSRTYQLSTVAQRHQSR